MMRILRRWRKLRLAAEAGRWTLGEEEDGGGGDGHLNEGEIEERKVGGMFSCSI